MTTEVNLVSELAKLLEQADRRVLGEYLNSCYSTRRERNPSYSIRAFSRDLGVDASDLSKALRYEKDLAVQTIRRIAEKLALPESTRKALLALAALREI